MSPKWYRSVQWLYHHIFYDCFMSWYMICINDIILVGPDAASVMPGSVNNRDRSWCRFLAKRLTVTSTMTWNKIINDSCQSELIWVLQSQKILSVSGKYGTDSTLISQTKKIWNNIISLVHMYNKHKRKQNRCCSFSLTVDPWE